MHASWNPNRAKHADEIVSGTSGSGIVFAGLWNWIACVFACDGVEERGEEPEEKRKTVWPEDRICRCLSE